MGGHGMPCMVLRNHELDNVFVIWYACVWGGEGGGGGWEGPMHHG